MSSTRLPLLATLVAGALGAAGHLQLIGPMPGSAAVHANVQRLRSDLAGRWGCDVATRRALLTDGDDAQLYEDVQQSCPAAADPLER
jgi:hypothetical protein